MGKTQDRQRQTMKELIGLKDKNGTDIREGDIIEFRVTYDAEANPTYDVPDATRMVDTVKMFGEVAMFWNDDIQQQGSYAWRHAGHCEVVGSIYNALPVS